MIDVKELKAGFSKGLGIAIGFFVIFGLALGVYAFVEPSSGPSADFYYDSNSPLISNYTLEFVGYSDTISTGNLGGIDGALAECTSLYEGSRPATYTDIIRLGPRYNFTYDIWFTDYVYDTSTAANCFHWTSASSSRSSLGLLTTGATTGANCATTTRRFACVRGN